jgi:hypothetical protein
MLPWETTTSTEDIKKRTQDCQEADETTDGKSERQLDGTWKHITKGARSQTHQVQLQSLAASQGCA